MNTAANKPTNKCWVPRLPMWRNRRANQFVETFVSTSFSSSSDDESSSEDDCEDQQPRKPRGATLAQRASYDATARWRRRVERRNNIHYRLLELGPLAAISCGSILVTTNRSGTPENLDSNSRWRVVYDSAPLHYHISPITKGRFATFEWFDYKRLEKALRSFGQMICLSVEDLREQVLIDAFAKFKALYVTTATCRGGSEIPVQGIKWLSKVCLAIILGQPAPECKFPEFIWEKPNGTKILGPFDGQLRFISDQYFMPVKGRRFTLEQSRALAQISSTSRALPYPTKDEVIDSVKNSVETFASKKEVSKTALKEYRRGTRKLREFLPPIKKHETHVSLSNSSCLEATRADGGRSAYMINLARKCTDQILTEEICQDLEGRKDCYGKIPIASGCWETISLLRVEGRQCYVGDILYLRIEDIISQLKFRLATEKLSAPLRLGEVLAMTASLDMLRYGHYSHPHTVKYNILTFNSTINFAKFLPDTDCIPVRAGLSIEAGMKTRLTTSAPAPLVVIGQLVGNRIREYLSHDPFTRIGFEEADKLWEVLKAYDKRLALSLI